MLTRANDWATLCLKADTVYASVGLLAKTDWVSIGLWAAASLVAASFLAAAMNRRRTTLTEALKKHVVDTIGPVGGEDGEEKSG